MGVVHTAIKGGIMTLDYQAGRVWDETGLFWRDPEVPVPRYDAPPTFAEILASRGLPGVGETRAIAQGGAAMSMSPYGPAPVEGQEVRLPDGALGLLIKAIPGEWAEGAYKKWSDLPPWVKVLLVAAGVAAGATLLYKAGQLRHLPSIGKLGAGALGLGGGGAMGGPPQNAIGGWEANGVQFYRLATGHLAVQRKNGTWRTWKPKKPIVIYAGGVSSLATLLKADKAIDAQAKRIGKMLSRRAPSARRTSSSARQIIEVRQAPLQIEGAR